MKITYTSFTGLLAIAALTTLSTRCEAVTDWVPTFDDEPVSEKEMKGVMQAIPPAAVQPQKVRTVLVFSATAGYRHDSIPIGQAALKAMGEQTGAYTAILSDDPANFEKPALQQFDAVILLSPTQDFFMPNNKKRGDFSDREWERLKERHSRLVDNLIDYVEEGGGLMGIHSATDACYGHEAYGEAIGGYFAGHPWNANMKVTIVVEDPDHATMRPVFKDKPDFKLVEEIYKFRQEVYSRGKLRVLLRLDPARSDPAGGVDMDGDYAVAWVQSVGKGRVFYTSIGHNKHIYQNPLMLQHYLAGIQFATGDLKADTTPSAHLKR